MLLLAPLAGCPAGVVATGEIDFSCADDSACAPGFVCVDGFCQPTGSHSTGDAATVDLGTGDRPGQDHAAIDAGGQDQVPQESSPGDRAGQDAAADSGGADAPSPDVLTADSGSPDVAPGDRAVDDGAGADGGADGAAGDDAAGADSGPDGGGGEDAAVTCPADWWDCAWGDRLKLSFDNSQQGEDLVDFPVLVTLDGSAIDYGLLQDDADDLRFMDADGTNLDHELEVWNEAGVSQVWVRVPQVNAYNVTDHIWMYYDNPSTGSAEDPDGV